MATTKPTSRSRAGSRRPARTSTIQSINPATGGVVETFAATSRRELDEVLDQSDRAFHDWRRRPWSERARLLRSAAGVLRSGKSKYARAMALEMGKPLAQGEAEAEKCATVCDYYAERGEALLEPQPRDLDGTASFVRFDPIGPVLAIMPWNFPFWQVFRFAAPALAAGNVGLLKHASNVTRCALLIEDVFRDAGFPDGAFRTLILRNSAVGDVIADARVRAVTLTGSERAGSDVAQHAGRHLKKTVLELGGSDAFIVLADADLARAARIAADARLINSGQSCIAAKRFIVVDAVADRFVERFVAEMRSRVMGDPLSAGTDVGPQARIDLRSALHRQVQQSVRRGARLATGGAIPSGAGAYYPPTVLLDVRPGMPAFDEEVFGPAAAVIRARDEADAIRLANASPYGLGAAVWTEDRARGRRIAAELDVGCVFINALVRSDPRLPFGGVKRSGYGRELAEFGLREFVNIKSVAVA
ncbi:MAG TPA: NAD-dependent succinate-semialdehyde dehydrogenase [Gemmatimonadales bacterium]|nr:NAD-dependent succinate-semialdehyde dehydrogenase [Gemmatimonadales bacterium]